MRALVIVESSAGNTRAVAEAIAEGLASSADVQVQEVDDGPPELPADLDLLVVGEWSWWAALGGRSHRAA